MKRAMSGRTRRLMAESARRLKAPPLNKTRDWKPPPRFKTVLTLLRSSAEAGALAKATPKCNALQKGALSVGNDEVAVVQALTVTNNLQSYIVERNRMKQAMELAEKLGYPSAGTMDYEQSTSHSA
jgi:hypothetical protein